ncbi:MAG: hypothetical protein WCI03_09135 [bacterium]
MPCDICSNHTTLTTLKASVMKQAVEGGFDPFAEGLLPPKLAQLATPDSPEDWKRQVLSGLLSHSDWNLCDSCQCAVGSVQ